MEDRTETPPPSFDKWTRNDRLADLLIAQGYCVEKVPSAATGRTAYLRVSTGWPPHDN